jgi:hypothetical protein
VKERLLRLVALILGHGAPFRDRRGVAPIDRVGAKPCGGTCLRTQGVTGGVGTRGSATTGSCVRCWACFARSKPRA